MYPPYIFDGQLMLLEFLVVFCPLRQVKPSEAIFQSIVKMSADRCFCAIGIPRLQCLQDVQMLGNRAAMAGVRRDQS